MMKSNQIVIGIRTHKWGFDEEKLYRKLQGYFPPEQIFIIVDETKKSVDLPTYLNKVSLNKELLQSFGILNTHPHSNGLGWLCGDYFYYAFANAIQADHYWLIEQDVDFTFHNIATFFQRFENIREDGLLHNFAEANENWAWTTRGKLIDEKVYQAFFPLSRLSRKAIEVCQIERKHLTTHFLEYKLDLSQYPNDEVLVATTLMKNHLKIVKLNDLWKSSFDYFSYKNSIVSPSAHLLLPENQVLHPSRTVEQFSSLITKEIDKAVQNSTTWLDLVDRSTLSVNDVEAIFDQIQENSLQEVKARLERHAKMLFWLDFTKKVVNKELENVSNDLHPRFWIYQGKTVVLDLAFNNATISIEYQINNKMITCNILNRHNAINYMESLKTKMKDYQEMNGKLCLFNLDILSEDISIRIEQSVSNFINLIKNLSE